MAKRHGMVLVFKKGVSKSRIVDAVKKLNAVLDPNYIVNHHDTRRIEEFDDNWGGPVWYVP